MIELNIKTLYQGRAAVHEKYIKQAKRQGTGLKLYRYFNIGHKVKEEVMIIHKDFVEKMIVERKGPFKDNYKKTTYYLCYYNWVVLSKETMKAIEKVTQEKLL